MKSKSFFGPKKQKSSPDYPLIGFFAWLSGQWKSVCLMPFSSQPLQYTSHVDINGLLDLMVESHTPRIWYSYEMRKCAYEIVHEGRDDEWLNTKIDRKGKSDDRLTIQNNKGGETIYVAIHDEKQHGKRKHKDDIELRNCSGIYDFDLEDLCNDFSQEDIPCPSDPDNALLYKALYGIVSVYEYAWHKLGVHLSTSFAGTVISAIRTNYLDTVVPRLPVSIDEFIRPALYGGRTEVFRIEQEHGYVYDKDGLYNEASTFKLPIKAIYCIDLISGEDLLKIKDPGFVDVDIYIPETLKRGPLPYRYNGETHYPVGELLSTKQHPVRYYVDELRQAVEMQGVEILKVNYAVFFRRSDTILQSWATFTARLKKESTNKGERRLAKLSQNAPYGKFAQSEERQITHIGPLPKDRRDDPSVSMPYDSHTPGDEEDLPIWFETVSRPLINHLPHIAAAITSNARMIMLRDMLKAESHGIHINYTDTDSLFTDKKLPEDMTNEAMLIGRYKCEFEDVTTLCIASKMYFILNEKGHCKVGKISGFPNYKPNDEDVRKLLKGIKLCVEWDATPSVTEALVARFVYEKNPENAYKSVLDAMNKKEKRTFPSEGMGKDVTKFDTRRHHLNMKESRPKNVSEIQTSVRRFVRK